MTDLDEKYRAEGWGTITDAALGIPPSNVESQARQVAQWAHEALETSTRHICDPVPGLLAQNEALRAALEAIELLRVGGPHTSAKEGFGAAMRALSTARNLATAALSKTEDET